MPMLFRRAHIFRPDGSLVDNHAILVDNERIARVAPEDEFVGYDGASEDLPNATILPGLMDAHVHLVYGAEANPSATLDALKPGQIAMKALLNARASLAAGITTIRDCGGKDHIEFAVRDACNQGHLLGPTIRAAGRMICMTGGHGNKNGRVADGVDEVVKGVREQIHAGCDLIKIMATGGVMTPGVNPEDAHYSEAELRAGIDEGHRFHRHSASHAQGADGILNATRAGVDSIEHGIFMTDECVEEMLARGTVLVPTLAAINNILRNADNGIPAFVVEKSQRVAVHHTASIKNFYDAGGTLVMGTDAGMPFNRHGENPLELAYMVDIGIKPADALVAATANPAKLMGLTDRGALVDGMAADLLIVDGNPVEDINRAANTDNHIMVVKNGVVARRRGMQGSVDTMSLAAI